MSLPKDYDTLCPIFNFSTKDGGVLFPYMPLNLGQADGNARYVNLDATAGSTSVFCRVRLPFKAYFLTCEAFAVSDDQGVKSAAASTEPVIAFTYGTYPLGSAAAGTEFSTITCSLSGPIGKKWAGSTTPITLETTQEIIGYVKTAAASGTSGKQDGGAVPVFWFAMCNAPV